MTRPSFLMNRFRGTPEDGVTLLLAVMIMAAVLVISITVAFFVVQEIKNSRASILTEPAIIAAETAGEQGIYRVKRSSFNTDCASAAYTQLSGSTGGSTSIRTKTCIVYDKAVFELSSDDPAPLEFYLYDPADVNGNLCMETSSCTGDQLYSSLIIKHILGNSSVYVNIVTLDGSNVATQVISPGSTNNFPIPRDILASTDERLKVTVLPTFGSATLEVNTTGVHTGLPDYRTIDAQGCVARTNIADCETNPETFNRRINITVPALQ
jgi:hypothetical protein